jgi:hypothetical protein
MTPPQTLSPLSSFRTPTGTRLIGGKNTQKAAQAAQKAVAAVLWVIGMVIGGLFILFMVTWPYWPPYGVA